MSEVPHVHHLNSQLQVQPESPLGKGRGGDGTLARRALEELDPQQPCEVPFLGVGLLQGSGFRVQGSGCGVQGSGFREWCAKSRLRSDCRDESVNVRQISTEDC